VSVAASKNGGRVLGGYFVLLAIFLYAPLAVMIIFAFDDSFVQTLPWSGFTTKWFHNAFSNEELIGSLKRSLWIGIVAAILATLLGLITAVGMTAHKLRLRGAITALVLLPLVIPYIVLAVGMLIR
jgi:spermidine/putrescine transport system permease protein